MNVSAIFGENVFNERVQREVLPREVFNALRKSIEQGKKLDVSIAGTVAAAMKDWAISKGATHYTHWFQPLTGLTAEKHDSFIEPVGDSVIMQLSGKALIVGESDASSFPSGGSRATSAARGYTAWDPTSPAFVKEGTLYIPTVFVSYTGETLDKKAPLLKSMEALDRETKRILKFFDMHPKRISTTVGPEQEYFLISKEVYEKRKDLILTGRTLFGAPASRGQELEDHYFGVLRPRVSAFMRDLDETLWSYGILAKTKHNEVAPAQHELVPVFTTANIAVDTNQLTMELLKKVAAKHGLVCLLHEKPFAGVNGSGKHNNWSLVTDTGVNLLEPKDQPEKNVLFMLILTAIIKAVDEYQGILRASVASAGNDHRLSAHEAPPTIISVYLGDHLGALVDSIVNGADFVSKKSIPGSIGVPSSPIFPKDATDRNRTSPFAFTNNKFEFRMLGSSASVADANIVLNTIVSEAFAEIADELEKVTTDKKGAIQRIISRELKAHHRIIFNCDGYSAEWEEEAIRRGLVNNRNTAEAVLEFKKQENIDVFVKHGVYTEAESRARVEIRLENYVKTLNVEVATMIDMARQQIYPAVSDYVATLCSNIIAKREVCPSLACASETKLVTELSALNDQMMTGVELLVEYKSQYEKMAVEEAALFIARKVVPMMDQVRAAADRMEMLTAKDYWPLPSYVDLMYYQD